MLIRYLLLILFIFSFVCCKAQNRKELDCCNLDSISKVFSAESYRKIHSMGKEIIPCLVDRIDSKEKCLIIGFIDSILSNIPAFMIDNYKGIQYAYSIEFILSKDTVETVKKGWNADQDFMHWTEIIKPYRIYKYGVIVKKDSKGTPILETLTHEDLMMVQKMYSKWWEKNKGKPIEELKQDRSEGTRILEDPYIWI